MFTIQLVNHSTRADVTPEWLASASAAVTRQLQEDFCPDYGRAAWVVTIEPMPGADEMAIFDSSDQAGALGYHATTPDGKPYARVFCEGQDLAGISVTISHECLELACDPEANSYRLAPDGTAYADEPCDAVEDTTYEIDGVTVSNFVTPAWYGDGEAKPYDHLGVLSAPCTKTDGGYVIRLVNGTVDTDPPMAKAHPSKRHAASRTARRMAQNAVKEAA